MVRIAVAVATADAMPNAFVVWRGIEESLEKAAQYGYDGIELALKTPDQVDAPALKRMLDDRGLACPCVSTGQVFAGLGLYFTTRDKAKRTQVIDVFKGMIDIAAQFGAMVNIGRSRGFVEDDETIDDATVRFVDVAREIAAHAQSNDVRLILEPVNRYEINFINSVAEGAVLMERVGVPNMGLMPDLFHMNIEDRALGGELEAHARHVSYIHFADSNRLAPGQGHTDFDAVFASLDRMQ
ncbi:MAG: TIM barrel protein, partial [Chitinivibrionales bacterium]|nr:TIM barrel protein [Chitinivibrionales bacterium]